MRGIIIHATARACLPSPSWSELMHVHMGGEMQAWGTECKGAAQACKVPSKAAACAHMQPQQRPGWLATCVAGVLVWALAPACLAGVLG